MEIFTKNKEVKKEDVYTNVFLLFFRCICGYLADKPRILVTHQLQFLKQASKILVLTEVSITITVIIIFTCRDICYKLYFSMQGRCVGQDTYQNLLQSGVVFISLMHEEEEVAGVEHEHEERDKIRHRFVRSISRQMSEQGGVCLRNTKLIESNLSVMSAATSASVYVSTVVYSQTFSCMFL